jgi:hypothetical protein
MGSVPMLLMETAMVHGVVGNVEPAKTFYQEALKILQVEKEKNRFE